MWDRKTVINRSKNSSKGETVTTKTQEKTVKRETENEKVPISRVEESSKTTMSTTPEKLSKPNESAVKKTEVSLAKEKKDPKVVNRPSQDLARSRKKTQEPTQRLEIPSIKMDLDVDEFPPDSEYVLTAPVAITTGVDMQSRQIHRLEQGTTFKIAEARLVQSDMGARIRGRLHDDKHLSGGWVSMKSHQYYWVKRKKSESPKTEAKKDVQTQTCQKELGKGVKEVTTERQSSAPELLENKAKSEETGVPAKAKGSGQKQKPSLKSGKKESSVPNASVKRTTQTNGEQIVDKNAEAGGNPKIASPKGREISKPILVDNMKSTASNFSARIPVEKASAGEEAKSSARAQGEASASARAQARTEEVARKPRIPPKADIPRDPPKTQGADKLSPPSVKPTEIPLPPSDDEFDVVVDKASRPQENANKMQKAGEEKPKEYLYIEKNVEDEGDPERRTGRRSVEVEVWKRVPLSHVKKEKKSGKKAQKQDLERKELELDLKAKELAKKEENLVRMSADLEKNKEDNQKLLLNIQRMATNQQEIRALDEESDKDLASKGQAVDDLRQKLALAVADKENLEEKVAHFQDMQKQDKKAKKELKKGADQLNKELQKSNQKILETKVELNKAREKIEELAAQLRAGAATQLARDQEEDSKELGQQKLALRRTRDEIGRLQKQFAERDSARKSLAEDVKEVEISLQKEMERKQKLVYSLEAERQKTNESVGKQRAENDALKEELQSLTQEASKLAEEIEAVAANSSSERGAQSVPDAAQETPAIFSKEAEASLQKEVEQNDKLFQGLEADRQKMDELISEQRTKNQALEQELWTLNEEAATLAKEKEVIIANLSTEKAVQSAHVSELDAGEKRKAELERALGAQRVQLAELESARAGREEVAAGLRAEVRAADEQIAALRERTSAAAATVKGLQSEVVKADQETSALEKAIEFRRQKSGELTQFHDDLDSTTVNLVALQEKMASLNEQCRGKEEFLQDLQKQCTEVVDEMQKTKKEVEELDQQVLNHAARAKLHSTSEGQEEKRWHWNNKQVIVCILVLCLMCVFLWFFRQKRRTPKYFLQ